MYKIKQFYSGELLSGFTSKSCELLSRSVKESDEVPSVKLLSGGLLYGIIISSIPYCTAWRRELWGRFDLHGGRLVSTVRPKNGSIFFSLTTTSSEHEGSRANASRGRQDALFRYRPAFFASSNREMLGRHELLFCSRLLLHLPPSNPDNLTKEPRPNF